MQNDRPLSTADLAKADEERNRNPEQVRGLDTSVGPPTHTDGPAGPPAAPKKDRARVETPGPARVEQSASATHPPLFAERDSTELRNRWSDVQTGFVDEPRRAVEQADSLVADVMKRLAESFAAERASLEKQWDRGDNVTTEDLRVALQRYRSFFDRLLTI
jgi:hypothetical protein